MSHSLDKSLGGGCVCGCVLKSARLFRKRLSLTIDWPENAGHGGVGSPTIKPQMKC